MYVVRYSSNPSSSWIISVHNKPQNLLPGFQPLIDVISSSREIKTAGQTERSLQLLDSYISLVTPVLKNGGMLLTRFNPIPYVKFGSKKRVQDLFGEVDGSRMSWGSLKRREKKGEEFNSLLDPRENFGNRIDPKETLYLFNSDWGTDFVANNVGNIWEFTDLRNQNEKKIQLKTGIGECLANLNLRIFEELKRKEDLDVEISSQVILQATLSEYVLRQ